MYSILIICSIINMLSFTIATYFLIARINYQTLKYKKTIFSFSLHCFFATLTFGITIFFIVFAIRRTVINYTLFDSLMFFTVIIIFIESSYFFLTLLVILYPQYFTNRRAVYHLRYWNALKILSDVIRWLSLILLIIAFAIIVANPFINRLNIIIDTESYIRRIWLLWLFVIFPSISIVIDSTLFFIEIFANKVKLTMQEIITYVLETLAMITVFIFLSIIAYEFRHVRNGSALSALFLDWLFVEYLNVFSYCVLLAILFVFVMLTIVQISIYEKKNIATQKTKAIANSREKNIVTNDKSTAITY